MKSRILLPVFLIFSLGMASFAQEQEHLTVLYDDGRSPDKIPVWEVEEGSEALYLRGNDVARIFKATQFWNASSRKIVLGIEQTRFTLTVDTRVVVVEGEPVMLRTPVRYEGGFVMIPLELIVDVISHYTPRVLKWDSASSTLRVEGMGYNVESIDFATAANRSTATIRLKEPLFHHMDTRTPGLVRLKIYGGRVDAKRFEIREPHGLFNGVRAEQTERDAYVYFDVKRIASRILVERGEDPPAIHVILEKGRLPEIPEPDFAGKRWVEILDETRAERRSIKIERIVIDPGHGGKDHGKIGATGVCEKDVNLDMAKAIRERIEEELGLEVILTREDDRLYSLTERTEIANEADGDLFISIHCNSWFNTQTGGFEAYFLSPARTEWDREVERVENAANAFSGSNGESGSDIDFILWDMVQNEFINESSHFAELVQKAMSEHLEIRNRGVKQANFTVLQGARMPAVLIETAFLSNPVEERLLSDAAFHRKVADGIVDAIKQFQERYQYSAGGWSGNDRYKSTGR